MKLFICIMLVSTIVLLWKTRLDSIKTIKRIKDKKSKWLEETYKAPSYDKPREIRRR